MFDIFTPVMDEETEELCDTYSIVKHSAECNAANVILKGKSWESQYLRDIGKLNEVRHELKKRLDAVGGKMKKKNGTVWKSKDL